MSKLGMPYMGSKRKLSKDIIDFILRENPNVKYIYDLFGGGGAISFEAQKRQQIEKVFYNELNTGVVELLKDIKENGVTDKYYQWIDKDTFFENRNANTWLGGFCKVVWSFSNNQKDYIYGKEVAVVKKLIHEVIVNKCEKSLKALNTIYQSNISMNVGLFEECVDSKRLRIQIESGVRIEHLERINQLKRINNYDKLSIYNLSYDEVKIETPVNETILYLDPPYNDKRGYQKSICNDMLQKYIKNSPYKIYVSEYESDLTCVLELKHTTSASNHKTSKVIERLFVNE